MKSIIFVSVIVCLLLLCTGCNLQNSSSQDKDMDTQLNAADEKQEELPDLETYSNQGNVSYENSQVDKNLCKANESIIYSFRTLGDGNVVSLSVDNEENYIIFRYGTKENLKVEYPNNTDASWSEFAYCYYLRGGGPDNEGMDVNFVTFADEDYSYILYEKYYAVDEDCLTGIIMINKDTGEENDIQGSADSVIGTLIDFRWNNKIIQGSLVDSLILE